MWTIKAVIFDLDGTLVDSAPDIQVAINKLLAEEGRRPVTLEEISAMIGDGAPKLVERAMNATGDGGTEDLPTLTRRFLGFYEGHTTDLTRPYPGVPEALERLRSAGVRIGICTNKPEKPTRELLQDLRLASYFQAVFGGDTVAGVKKPDPRLIHCVLDALGARPTEAVMVGDAANDVAAARAAGIPVILRAGGYTRVPAKELDADRIITGFLELPEAIRGFFAVDAGATGEDAGLYATAREKRVRAIAEQLTGQTLMHQDRGGMGSHKHGVSGRPGPRPALKRFLAEFFNEEDKRRTKRRSQMYSSLREALRQFKPK